MDGAEVHACEGPRAAGVGLDALAGGLRHVDGLLEALAQPLECGREVEGAAFLEFHDELERGVRGGETTAVDGRDDGFPLVGAEPGGGDARVGDVEDGDREGLEGGRGGEGEVYDLWGGLASCGEEGVRGTYPSVCEVYDAGFALLAEGFGGVASV